MSLCELGLDNILEVKMIRDILKDNEILKIFFDELVSMMDKRDVYILTLNEYDEDIGIYDTESDEEEWEL
tara:strand:- start:2111 stop:2320 length:210 start_codon:yes stop_codon:yes gene_type:complete